MFTFAGILKNACGNFILRLAMTTPLFLLPLYLQWQLHKSAFVSGCCLLVNAVAFSLAYPLSIIFKSWLKQTWVMRTSIVFYALSFILLAVTLRSTHLVLLMLALFVNGLLLALLIPHLGARIYASVPVACLSQSTTFVSMSGQISASLAVVVCVALLHVFTSSLTSQIIAYQGVLYVESLLPIVALFFLTV